MFNRMTEDFFLSSIKIFYEVFDAKYFKGARLRKIKSMAFRYTKEEWTDILDRVMCEYKTAPLPKDFYKIAKQLKNEKFSKGNFNSRQDYGHGEREPTVIDCDVCCDTGLCFAAKKNGFSHLVRCSCERHNGLEMSPALPTLTQVSKLGFERRRIEPRNFIPTGENGGMWEIAEKWKMRVKDSVSYWSQEHSL